MFTFSNGLHPRARAWSRPIPREELVRVAPLDAREPLVAAAIHRTREEFLREREEELKQWRLRRS